MSGFCQISSSAGPSQKCQFLVKFSTRLQISGCCQISSFAGPEWSKVSILSQMFEATENFWIVPNFILCMLWVVKNVSFELVFDTNQNFLILQNWDQEWSNSQFQAKFSTLLKISGFYQISFAGLQWSKIAFLSQIFNTNQNFYWFCKISSFAGLEWSKISFLSQIFNTNQNFSGFCQISSFLVF